MKIVVFSKSLRDESIDGIIQIARDYGFEGYDLCVREGYPVNPDNVGKELVGTVKRFDKEGLVIPMVTASPDLRTPDDPRSESILGAMDEANVRFLKMGYFRFNPLEQDYWAEVDKVRRALEGWEKLGSRHRVKVCYHTHSDFYMGLNCAALAHLVRGFNPSFIGAYIDPGHMLVQGEAFSFGAAILKEYLSIVAVKDVRHVRIDKNDHGAVRQEWVEAGMGMVDWTEVFVELARMGFNGPVSIQPEYGKPTSKEFLTAVSADSAFFKKKRCEAQSGKPSRSPTLTGRV